MRNLPSSWLALSAASLGIPESLMACSYLSASFGAFSSSPISFWMAFICSLR